MTPIASLAAAWLNRFGPDAPVHPSNLLDSAVLPSFSQLIPALLDHPDRRVVIAYLDAIQERPIRLAGKTYRFTRAGHRWELVELVSIAA